MTFSRRCCTWLLCLLTYLTCNSHNVIAAKTSTTTLEKIGIVSLVAGITGLATYTIIKISNLILGPSDEVFAEKTIKIYRKAYAHYAPLLSIIDESHGTCNDHIISINDVSEDALYKLARAKYDDHDIASYIKNLKNTCLTLERSFKKLRDRIKKLSAAVDEGNCDCKKLYHTMQTIDDELQTFMPKLRLLHDYLKNHQSYFSLFELEDKLIYRYEHELETLNNYGNDLDKLRENIHQLVMLQQRMHRQLFPYRWYLQRLESDIDILSKETFKLSYNYANRISTARSLADKLQTLRVTIVGSPYYLDEIKRYEQGQVMKKLIDTQERQACAQEAIAIKTLQSKQH